MKSMKLFCGLMMLAGVTISGSALADRGHGGSGGHGGYGGHGSYGGHGGHFGMGLYFGVPYPYSYYPYPYAYPYDYYPPVVITPAQPPVYVEQGAMPPSTSPQQAPNTSNNYYWYHCDNPDGYYPYVKECPSGWQKVVPTPPSQ